jgi:hypothetical protein
MLPQFYNKIAALNVAQHGAVHMQAVDNHEFAGASNVIHLQVTEFCKALSTYPIVFIGEKDQLWAAALTGLSKEKNLFVDDKGAWSDDYIPAYVRRYPFVIANIDKGKSTVCIDESYSGFNNDGQGEALFTSDGEHSDYLKQTITFLQDFEQAAVKTEFFCQQLMAFDLLEPMSAKVEPKNDQREEVLLQGFSVVSREKLAKLPADTLKQLNDNGILELIYNHLASLEQFDALLARYNR